MAKAFKKTTIDKISADIERLDFSIFIVLVLSIGIIPLLLRLKVIKFVAPKLIHPILNTGIQTNIFHIINGFY